MFRKVLIANRGEIACRIIRACRKLGMTSVAVYSDADRDAPHVSMADESYHIGGVRPVESYLDISKILSVATESKSEAVHPGYGFLSENADFARATREAGLEFVGPSSEVLRWMGDKVLSRRLAVEAGLPVVPGSIGAVSAKEADDVVRAIGYPVIVKGVGGGGGIGTAIASSNKELKTALERAANVNQRAFGKAEVYIERFLKDPSHVEVQVLGDRQGNVVHLFERDCSVQRRHQKVIEETPCPKINERTRDALHRAAVAFARHIGYHNAGTIEFLMDKDQNFYFLEVNPRLQVEHRVTEVTTGVDIVEWQFRIACKEKMGFLQEELVQRGHATEARVYAEDPKSFLPSSGQIRGFKPPPGVDLVVDSGVTLNYEITPYYDPLLAKVIAWGEGRLESIERLRLALQRFEIKGVDTNIPALIRVLGLEAFRRGRYSTSLLSTLGKGVVEEEEDFAALMRAYGR